MIRPSRPDDLPHLLRLGEEWDLGDGPFEFGDDYLDLVACCGTVLVAEDDGRVAGFGGALPLRGGVMVTDLFVAAAHHGRGIGGRLLDALVAGHERRMTCSSAHPSAVPTYVSRGMQPRWHLRYLEGFAAAGSPTPVAVVDIPRSQVVDERTVLVDAWEAAGARFVGLVDVRDDPVGHAVLVPEPAGWSVPVLATTVDHGHAMAAVLASLEPGTPVTTWVPEWSSAALVLDELDFVETDADVWCATDTRATSRRVAALHPGFG